MTKSNFGCNTGGAAGLRVQETTLPHLERGVLSPI
jgi:hypothetical protein